MPIYRPQLYEVDSDTVKLSWSPVTFPVEAGHRPSVRYRAGNLSHRIIL